MRRGFTPLRGYTGVFTSNPRSKPIVPLNKQNQALRNEVAGIDVATLSAGDCGSAELASASASSAAMSVAAVAPGSSAADAAASRGRQGRIGCVSTQA